MHQRHQRQKQRNVKQPIQQHRQHRASEPRAGQSIQWHRQHTVSDAKTEALFGVHAAALLTSSRHGNISVEA